MTEKASNKRRRPSTEFLRERSFSNSELVSADEAPAKMMNLAELRELSVRRGIEAEQNNKRKVDALIESDRAVRLKSLPHMCGSFRSLCLLKKKTVFKLTDVVQQFAMDLGLTKVEAKSSILLLVEHVPEFISIQPRDDLLPHDMIKINMATPYAEIRTRLQDIDSDV